MLQFTKDFSKNQVLDFQIYADAYYKAATILYEDIRTNGVNNDAHCYPVFYLYRHAIELYLKGCFYYLQYISKFMEIELPIKKDFYNNHDLYELNSIVKSIIKKVFENENDVLTEYGKIWTTIKWFHDNDPTSFSFRYPIDKKGKNPDKLKHYDLCDIEEKSKKIITHLQTFIFGCECKYYQVIKEYEEK